MYLIYIYDSILLLNLTSRTAESQFSPRKLFSVMLLFSLSVSSHHSAPLSHDLLLYTDMFTQSIHGHMWLPTCGVSCWFDNSTWYLTTHCRHIPAWINYKSVGNMQMLWQLWNLCSPSFTKHYLNQIFSFPFKLHKHLLSPLKNPP